MALTQDSPRTIELGHRNEYPVAASVTIYSGAMLGLKADDGMARPLVAGDAFLGIAESAVAASTVAGTNRVRVIDEGKMVAAISGAVITDVGAKAYASDDATITKTATSNSEIGKIVRFISSGVAVVRFKAMP